MTKAQEELLKAAIDRLVQAECEMNDFIKTLSRDGSLTPYEVREITRLEQETSLARMEVIRTEYDIKRFA
jgi:phosphoenolpyruvate carboxylase